MIYNSAYFKKAMKKTLYIISTIVEVCFLIGAYLFNYYTINKLGMVRWVNAHCISWEKTYPIMMIKSAVVVLLIIFFLTLLYQYIKQRKSVRNITTAMMVVTIILMIFILGYVLSFSFAIKRAYYFVSIMLVVAMILQMIKLHVEIRICKKSMKK